MINRFLPQPRLLQRSLSLLVAMLLLWTATGCSLEQFKVSAAQVPEIIASTVGDPKTFNFPLNQESPNVFGYIYEGLISEDGITGEIEPALSESWEFSADKRRLVHTLRPGLKWSDGQPLTADDIVFTYNDIYLNEKIPTDARDVLRVGQSGALPQVRKLDDRRIEFTIPEPFAPFLRVTGLPILPAHSLRPAVTTLGPDGQPKFNTMLGVDTDPRTIVVNGPFTLDSYATSQRVVFRKNPYYWKRDAAGNSLPYIDRFVWQIVESTDTSLLQFRSGGLDVIGVSPMNFALLKREEDPGNFRIYNGGPASGVSFISFNLNQGRRNGKPLVNPVRSRWFNNVAFRQAIAYGIDRQRMINNTYRGLGATQNSPLSVQSPYYLPPEQGLKVYDYNPDKAKQLLQGAGFKYNNQKQLVDDQGNRVRFTLMTNTGSPTAEAIGSQIKRDLSQIGIQVDFQVISFNALVDKLTNSLDWETYFGGFTGGVEPNDGFNIWNPEGGLHNFNQAALPGQPPIEGRQVSDWEREIGQLYIQGAQELDEARRKAIYGRTQQITQEYLPFIYMVNPLSLAAVRNTIQGVQPSGLSGTLWNLPELKVEQRPS